MQRRIVFALILTALAPLCAARAEYVPPQCQTVYARMDAGPETEALEAEFEACQRAAIGVAPIEQRALDARRVLRAQVTDGQHAVPVFVEYVEPKAGRPWLTVLSPIDGSAHRRVTVSKTSFDIVWRRWMAQPRHTPPVPQADVTVHFLVTFCIPGYLRTLVETANRGVTKSVQLDTCNIPEYKFSFFLLRRARHDIGPCPKSQIPDPSDADRLLACLSTR
ncbi:MAG TPA: hypothetical protein VHZ78_08970 [Rhizomicrobium sp.]|jgi:hypothetical protein|nr:hypothetical protein [Rhizomicrobium sp.]